MPLLPSALPPKGEARRYVANDFLNLIALPLRGRCPEGADRAVAVCKSKGKGVLSELAFPAAWYDEKRGCRKAAFKSLVTPDP